jgi:hypothetical protein
MKAKLTDEISGTYKIKCPAGHNHYINTKSPNGQGAIWHFNGDLEKPTFTPSINETTGYYVDPSLEKTKSYSYHCHFVVTDGNIFFCIDCSHDLKNQTMELPDLEDM